jgi:RNA polymerase sigma factor (sigma-70 family)
MNGVSPVRSGAGAPSRPDRDEESVERGPVVRQAVRSDADWFLAGLSPALLAGIRRRIAWTARAKGARLRADAIDDLVQELLLRLWVRGFRGEVASFPAYALRAAGNLTIETLCRRRARKRQAPTARDDESAALLAPWPSTPEQIAIDRDALRQALADCRHLLSARDYRIFTLFYVAGFTGREVAARVGLKPSSVDSVLHRLRRWLGENDLVVRPRASRRFENDCGGKSSRESREDRR